MMEDMVPDRGETTRLAAIKGRVKERRNPGRAEVAKSLKTTQSSEEEEKGGSGLAQMASGQQMSKRKQNSSAPVVLPSHTGSGRPKSG